MTSRCLLSGLISIAILLFGQVHASGESPALSWIKVAPDGKSFIEADSGKSFIPWGFNYDHDENGRLIEDYWDKEWAKIENDFAAMKALRANSVRIHLQFGAFMDSATKPRGASLDRLKKLAQLGREHGLYLNLTGLGCYHKKDVPNWYDQMSEKERWESQAVFWKAVAGAIKDDSSIFCLDLMNEPVVSGAKRKPGDWLGPPFAGKHFVQFIALDPADRPRPEVARAWTEFLVAEIRKVDKKHLITVGLADWSLDRPGLTSGFVPAKTSRALDFLSVHLYPEKGKAAKDLATLQGFDLGKPLVLEETFPLKCDPRELAAFLKTARPPLAGVFSFYWGKPLEQLKRSSSLGDQVLAQWLEAFTTAKPQ